MDIDWGSCYDDENENNAQCKKITKMLKTTVNWRHINKNDVVIFSHNQWEQKAGSKS